MAQPVRITLDQILTECSVKEECLKKECSKKKLLDLAEYCDPISVVGHALGLTKAQVSAINNDYKTTKEKRLALMQEWKESFAFRATYKTFIEALLASGKAGQASEICRMLNVNDEEEMKEYICQAEVSDSKPSCTSTPTDVQPDSEQNEMQQEGAPQSEAVSRDLPDNQSDDDHSMESSTDEQSQHLDSLVDELDDDYSQLGEAISNCLIEKEISMVQLQTYAATLPIRVRKCYKELKTNELPTKIRSATTVGEFVAALNDYSNFLNPALIEDSIKKFGDKKTKLLMCAYKTKLDEFQATTTLVQFVTVCSWEGKSPEYYHQIELELKANWENKTFKDIEPPKKSWLFKKVFFGSLRVVFSIPNVEDLEKEDVREYLQHHTKRVFVNGMCVIHFETDKVRQLESETVQLTEIPSDFRFSSVSHGDNIVLSEDGLEARCKKGRDAGVYIDTPLQGTCEFEVEVTDSADSSKSMRIGVRQCPTGPYKHLDIPHIMFVDSCIWSSGSVRIDLSDDVIETKYGSMDLKTGDKVAVRLSDNGDLHFFLNGVDQGLAARNVYRQGWDTYPLIFIGGSCKAVKITRAVLSEYAKCRRDQQSSENVSPHNVQFRFHPVAGKNIMLFEDGLYARRKDVYYVNMAIVYGAMPIKHRGTFEVIITEYGRHSGIDQTIKIGVMRKPTSTELKQSNVPYDSCDDFSPHSVSNNHFVWMGDKVYYSLSGHCDSWPCKPFVCTYGHVNLLDLREGDKVGLRLSSDGTLSFFVNGKNQGVAVRGLHKEGYDLHPMVDVHCNCHGVRITRAESHSEYEVSDLQGLCVEKIASCLDWSSKNVNLLPLPQRLKNQIEQEIDLL